MTIPSQIGPEPTLPSVESRLQKLHEPREALRKRLAEAAVRMAKYYDRNHLPKQFSVGDLIKLSTRNLGLKYRKLKPRWIGPFRITELIGGQAYRLALPTKYARLRDVFPVQLLEDYHGRVEEGLMPSPDLDEHEDVWEVEAARDEVDLNGEAGEAGTKHFLVKWAGWPSEYNTWEPENHLAGARGVTRTYRKKQKKRSAAAGDDVVDEAAGPGKGLPKGMTASRKSATCFSTHLVLTHTSSSSTA